MLFVVICLTVASSVGVGVSKYVGIEARADVIPLNSCLEGHRTPYILPGPKCR